MRDPAVLSHLFGLPLDLAARLFRRGRTRPDEPGAGQHIQHQVASGDFRLLSLQDQHRPQTQTRGSSRRQPGMVTLRRAAGNQRRRTSGQRLSTRVLKLADLVAAAAKPAQVITLHPQGISGQPHRSRQTGSRLQRSRPGTQHDRRWPRIGRHDCRVPNQTPRTVKKGASSHRGPLREIVTALENDDRVKVVVFESAVDGLFLNHSHFLAKLEDLTSIPQGPTGLEAWPDVLVRLTRAPFVSIALIRGRATGNGSELVLACDMSFASREKALWSQWKWAWTSSLAEGPWRDCRGSWGGGAPSKCS